MAGINIFDTDAFGGFELTAALNNVPHKPQLLGSLGIFESAPVMTEVVAVEQRENDLALVGTTPRGAPLPQRPKDARNIRNFRTVRVAKGDRLMASELQNIRAFGSMSELEVVQSEVMRRLVGVRNDVELTHEYMRLGAVQGILTDADASTIYSYYTEFGIAQATEVDFDLDNASPASGAVRKKCNAIIRAMQRAANGLWTPSTEVIGLCGDNFYDDLTAHSEVRQTYLTQPEQSALRETVGRAFDAFRYGGITFVNYRGTDDNSTVAVGTDSCKFLPTGAPGVFQWVQSPGESFDWVNTPGQPFYAMQVPDKDRNQFVDLEVYSYPLYICTRPGMLQRAKRT